MRVWRQGDVGRADFRPRRRPPPEKALDAAVMRALRGLGFAVTRLQQPRRSMVTRGVPDLYAMQPVWGIAVWLELKAPGEPLSPAQEAWHAVARDTGVGVFTLWSVDDLLQALRGLGAPIEEAG